MSAQFDHWQSHSAIIQFNFCSEESNNEIQIVQSGFLAINAEINNLQVFNLDTNIFKLKLYIIKTPKWLLMACCLAIGTAGPTFYNSIRSLLKLSQLEFQNNKTFKGQWKSEKCMQN